MKIAIIGDTHFGARNSNQVIEHWQKRFYEEFLWPKIDEMGIKTIIQTGDYFDNRKWINLQTMAFQKEVFVKQAQKRKISTFVIVGNHDIPLRHSLANSSVEQILSNEDFFRVVTKTHTEDFDGRKVTLMPWICRDNEEESLKTLRTGGDIVLGHFEITGFVMHPGAIAHDGLSMSDFDNWNKVWSGHYHTQSENKNIHYVGTPYQMSWNDFSTKHGFWVYDTTDDSMVFHENPFRYFNRFTWENGCNKTTNDLNKSYVKINVKRKDNFEEFEKFIDWVNFGNPFEVKITESFEEFSADNVSDLIELHSTEELISEYVEDVAANNKDDIKNLMLEIYNEALTIEDL
jgi:DNA repair exonuclease SbcCD nuclease subunit